MYLFHSIEELFFGRIRFALNQQPDRNQTDSRRSKPNSRSTFMGEHPNPWALIHAQDVLSRHRGAKPSRR